MSRSITCVMTLLSVAVWLASASAQEHHHGHGDKPTEPPPRIFLDKSPRVIWYQLNRLTNERLLMVERADDDPLYAPVYTAILIRGGMSRQFRDEALAALVKLRASTGVAEVLKAFDELDADDRQSKAVARQLAALLLSQDSDLLARSVSELTAAATSDNSLLRPTAYAALIAAQQQDSAWKLAQASEPAALDFLAGLPLVAKPSQRAQLRDAVIDLASDGVGSPAVRKAAIRSLAFVPGSEAATFQLVAGFVSDHAYQTVAIKTLLSISKEHREAAVSLELLDVLVNHAEATPAAERTTDDFIDAMQLADELMASAPVAKARSYRERLRAITVRVVRINTVEEEMRYDTPFFAVEAGRPVQVVLHNEDLMPHNFVITTPGTLQEVAIAGALLTRNPGGTPYVPQSHKVLQFTDMIQPHQQARLTFTAPTEPGEYPYVCTFPRHWMRMYGVMIVVDDLDAWLKDPQAPTDPTGNNRSFVQSWTFEDLAGDVTTNLRGRSPEIGGRIFKEATCAQCHKVAGQGGAVGPELTDVFKRWKGDHLGVLREIVEPSHKVDPKFAVQVILTVDGRILSGIVTSEDKDTISVVVNPEAPEPTVIKRDDIDEIEKSSKSLMPKALLDRFTKDEIFELLSYLEYAAAPAATP
ncbi:MAG: plastocyanin/azurin family copper-binding protein [Planctomycetota bacterium]|nr:plastocyanin/azurin family copper-binding protein [Planctomycetota bacterium]